MKRILPSLPFFLLLLSFSLCAQTENTAESSYTEYFKLPRETIFLHLNKTTYLSGEEVWFKGYAYDQKNQLTSKATTNFNVGIYDSDGKEVKRALFRGENGFTKGNLLIDSTFVSGTYYIKASTNWMKNFQDDGAYIQKIEVFGDKIIGTNDENDAKNKYDFQFLPEGGHMVANTKNNIGFKVIDANGKGIAATGSIFNENNEEVTKFKSNSLGLGKFLFQPKLNQKYTSKITLASGETIEQEIQISKGQGITIIMNNLFPDRTIITLNTNAKTLENNSNATYKLLIHQSGKLKTVNFTFDQGTSKTITIPKKELFKGINTVTLFDENEQPILERLFFNALDMKKASVSVSKLTTVNDSIILSVKELNLASDANISISILPEETESYAPNNNIISSFVLKPYLKGFVENPEYYFAKLDRKHQYELDILLLTQGWSKYNWDAIFKNPPKQNHRFENGITIKGKVNSPASGIDKLFLYATKNHQAQFIPLNEDQSFTLRNLYLEKGERVRFSYTDKSGIFKKPSMYISFNITDKEDNISTSISNEKSTNVPSSSLETFSSKDFFYEDLEELETITIEGKRTKKETDAVAIRGTYKKVTVNEFSRFPYVLDYIRNNGYNVSEDTGIANRTGEVTITDRNRLSFGAKTSPLVFLDDMPLTSFNILYNYSMANVEKILIDRSGFGYGLRSAGGVIKIYTRTTALYQDEKGRASISNTSIAPFSFQKAKEYYAPKYSSYTNSSFRKYGVISWIPELVLNKNATTTFKVFNTRTKRAIVFIEGITKDGNLISQKQIIDLSKNKL